MTILKHKYTVLVLTIGILSTVFFAVPTYAQSAAPLRSYLIAEVTPANNNTSTEAKPKPTVTKQDDVSQAMIESANYVLIAIKWLYIFLIPILAIIGKFMSNDWVVGNVLNLDMVIGVIWQYVRNTVNISMMLYLLYLAGANIVSIGSINFKKDIKAELPKVAMVLVAVNFSLLLCRTILGIAGAVTVAAFSIPHEIGPLTPVWNTPETTPFIWEVPVGNKILKSSDNSTTVTTDSFYMECIHKNYAISLRSIQDGDVGKMVIPNPSQNTVTGQYLSPVENEQRIIINGPKYSIDKNTSRQYVNDTFKKEIAQAKTNIVTQVTNGGSSIPAYYKDCVTGWDDLFFSEKNAMFVFAFNLMQIGEYENGLGNISSVGDLFTRGFISIVYLGLFFAITLALMFAVVLRGIMLWFLMALSPIWVMVKLLGNLGVKQLDQLGSIEMFVSLAFMPAVLGFILSMGFMMISYIKYIGKMENLDAGRFPLGALNIYFDPNNPILGGMSSIFDMIIAIVTVVVLWQAVKFAFEFGFKKAEGIPFLGAAYKSTVQKVIEATGKTGNFMRDLPLRTPFIPIGKGDKLSLSGITRLPEVMDRKLQELGNDDAEVLNRRFGRTRMDATKYAKLVQDFTPTIQTKDKFHQNMSSFDAHNVQERETMFKFLKAINKFDDTAGTGVMEVDLGDGNKATIDNSTAKSLKAMYRTINGNQMLLDHVVNNGDNGLFNNTMFTSAHWDKVNELLTGKNHNPFTYDTGSNTIKDNGVSKILSTGVVYGGTSGNAVLQKIVTDITTNAGTLSTWLTTSGNDLKTALDKIFAELGATDAAKKRNILSALGIDKPEIVNLLNLP